MANKTGNLMIFLHSSCNPSLVHTLVLWIFGRRTGCSRCCRSIRSPKRSQGIIHSVFTSLNLDS